MKEKKRTRAKQKSKKNEDKSIDIHGIHFELNNFGKIDLAGFNSRSVTKQFAGWENITLSFVQWFALDSEIWEQSRQAGLAAPFIKDYKSSLRFLQQRSRSFIRKMGIEKNQSTKLFSLLQTKWSTYVAIRRLADFGDFSDRDFPFSKHIDLLIDELIRDPLGNPPYDATTPRVLGRNDHKRIWDLANHHLGDPIIEDVGIGPAGKIGIDDLLTAIHKKRLRFFDEILSLNLWVDVLAEDDLPLGVDPMGELAILAKDPCVFLAVRGPEYTPIWSSEFNILEIQPPYACGGERVTIRGTGEVSGIFPIEIPTGDLPIKINQEAVDNIDSHDDVWEVIFTLPRNAIAGDLKFGGPATLHAIIEDPCQLIHPIKKDSNTYREAFWGGSTPALQEATISPTGCDGTLDGESKLQNEESIDIPADSSYTINFLITNEPLHIQVKRRQPGPGGVSADELIFDEHYELEDYSSNDRLIHLPLEDSNKIIAETTEVKYIVFATNRCLGERGPSTDLSSAGTKPGGSSKFGVPVPLMEIGSITINRVYTDPKIEIPVFFVHYTIPGLFPSESLLAGGEGTILRLLDDDGVSIYVKATVGSFSRITRIVVQEKLDTGDWGDTKLFWEGTACNTRIETTQQKFTLRAGSTAIRAQMQMEDDSSFNTTEQTIHVNPAPRVLICIAKGGFQSEILKAGLAAAAVGGVAFPVWAAAAGFGLVGALFFSDEDTPQCDYEKCKLFKLNKDFCDSEHDGDCKDLCESGMRLLVDHLVQARLVGRVQWKTRNDDTCFQRRYSSLKVRIVYAGFEASETEVLSGLHGMDWSFQEELRIFANSGWKDVILIGHSHGGAEMKRMVTHPDWPASLRCRLFVNLDGTDELGPISSVGHRPERILNFYQTQHFLYWYQRGSPIDEVDRSRGDCEYNLTRDILHVTFDTSVFVHNRTIEMIEDVLKNIRREARES